MAKTAKTEKPLLMNLRWSEADDKLLREMIEKGANATSISQTLGRTRASVYNRKLQLGIEKKITRTPKGMSSPLTFGSKAARKKIEELAEAVVVVENKPEVVKKAKVKKPAKAKAKAKTTAEETEKVVKADKQEKGRLSQTAKLVQINRRIRRGDIRKIAQKTGFTEGFVSTVINGLNPNERIINVAFNMLRGRKTNEYMMKK